MPKLVTAFPKYRRRADRDSAFVVVAGKRIYLPGPYNSPESRAEYKRLCLEWQVSDQQPESPHANELTITELIDRFWIWAQAFYVKNGRPTGAAENIRPTLRLLNQTYGHTRAIDFGPLALKAMMQAFVNRGLSRRGVNDGMHRIRQVFKWAASEEIIPEEIHRALMTVSGLRKHRTPARETQPVMPVADDVVDRTLPYLPSVVRDMVQLQRLTGARPGEIIQMRPADIDRTGPVWRFTPQEHKTEHHERKRIVCIGPRAQMILKPYLLRADETCCFVPSESAEKQRRRRTMNRTTPLSCGNLPGDRSTKRRRSPPGDCYSTDTYRRAITRGCELAFGMPAELRKIPAKGRAPEQERRRLQSLANEWRAANCWHPHQLRHTAATEVRRTFGLEHAQMVLGHSRADVTQTYTARNLELAETVAAQMG
ncbi:MAG: site-specific integrase [Planctomycetes bacterium]|nr:site-specific integrase [Planctomycetota bacterium]